MSFTNFVKITGNRMGGMGLSIPDAVRLLNVHRSVVQRLWDQFESENSILKRNVLGHPRITNPTHDRFLVLSSRMRRNTTVAQLI